MSLTKIFIGLCHSLLIKSPFVLAFAGSVKRAAMQTQGHRPILGTPEWDEIYTE